MVKNKDKKEALSLKFICNNRAFLALPSILGPLG